VVLVEPEEGAGDEVVLNFVAAVIVDEGAPVGMGALAGVFVLVEVSAVEAGQAVIVAGEMSGSPVEKDADAGGVAGVDEEHEVGGGAVAGGGGEIAEGLVAPGGVEGMLHDGEKFDMGIAHLEDVGNELCGEFAVGEPAIVFAGDAAPGAEMNFVDGDGGLDPVF